MAIMSGLFTLGRDAELKTTSSGTSVCELALAYDYGMKGQDGRKPTQWVRGALWGKQGEALAQWLTKGKQIAATLEDVHVRTYRKNDGTDGHSLEGKVIQIEFARGNPRQDDAAPQRQARPAQPSRAPAPASSGFDAADEDIPF